MIIEDIRTIVWSNIGQDRLQIKVQGVWHDVRCIDAEREYADNGNEYEALDEK